MFFNCKVFPFPRLFSHSYPESNLDIFTKSEVSCVHSIFCKRAHILTHMHNRIYEDTHPQTYVTELKFYWCERRYPKRFIRVVWMKTHKNCQKENLFKSCSCLMAAEWWWVTILCMSVCLRGRWAQTNIL